MSANYRKAAAKASLRGERSRPLCAIVSFHRQKLPTTRIDRTTQENARRLPNVNKKNHSHPKKMQ
jgi:hypothetical protein